VGLWSRIRALLAGRRGGSRLPILATMRVPGPARIDMTPQPMAPSSAGPATESVEDESAEPTTRESDGTDADSTPEQTRDPTTSVPGRDAAQSIPVELPEHDLAVPRGIRVAAAWGWRAIVLAIVLYGLGWVARYLSEVLIPVAVAILLTALLSPVANRLRIWRLPRAAATAVTVLGGLVVIVGVLILIGSQIATHSSSLTGNVVAGFNQLVGWLKNGPLQVSQDWFDVDAWGARIQNFVKDSGDTIAKYAGEISAQVGHFFAGLAITLFSLFYFLYDGRGLFRFVLKLVPISSRERVDNAARQGWRSLSSYVKATILVAFVDALGVLIAALILRVPLAPALAALVFLGAFVPIVGALVSGFLAVIVALVVLGWVKALIMLGCIILVMQVEGHVMQPFLLGRAVKLHPLAVILAIAAGIIVGGIIGALLAVPLLAFSKTFVQHLAGATEPALATAVRWPSGRGRH
jgi:predicted PurR-regulated permease PerM